MQLIDSSHGYPATIHGVIVLKSGRQVELLDVDYPDKAVMVASLSTDNIEIVPINHTHLEIIK